ncbi:MAG: hypothetical protein F6K16_34135 [Symploca sp. SIO2B6]|nr:hypothetical protein [Symploca sp. SIO2B6]
MISHSPVEADSIFVLNPPLECPISFCSVLLWVAGRLLHQSWHIRIGILGSTLKTASPLRCHPNSIIGI